MVVAGDAPIVSCRMHGILMHPLIVTTKKRICIESGRYREPKLHITHHTLQRTPMPDECQSESLPYSATVAYNQNGDNPPTRVD